MRLLVTGAGGLLGGRLARLLAADFAVTATRHRQAPPAGLPTLPLDLLSRASLRACLDEAAPEAVVHAAALANADACEGDPALAEALNVRAPAELARLCRERGIRLVVLSTDLVLPGDAPLAREETPAEPLLVYGRTKLRGEEETLAACPGAAVARVALVHGRGHGPGGSASESIAWALRRGESPALYVDQFRTPVDAESVAAGLSAILRQGAEGRFHLGGPERLSRHALGLRVARVLGLPEVRIRAARHADQPGATRPADASLDSGRARRELGYLPRSLDQGISEGRREPPRG